MNWSQDDYRAFLARNPPRQRTAGDIPRRVPVPVANVEPNTRDETTPPSTPKIRDQRVELHFHSIRKRLTDIDGQCAKWCIDSLVACEILQGDGPEIVASVTFSQEKGEPERTILTIRPVSATPIRKTV